MSNHVGHRYCFPIPPFRDFNETVQARAKGASAFREATLKEGAECLLAVDVDAGEIVLGDYINATIGFDSSSTRPRERGCPSSSSPAGTSWCLFPCGNNCGNESQNPPVS